MSDYQKAIAVADLPLNTCREVQVGGKTIAVYNAQGTFYASTNFCPHRGGPLGQGMVDGATVMCPWHAWTWDLTNGENTANGTLKIAMYPVKVEGGAVWVALD